MSNFLLLGGGVGGGGGDNKNLVRNSGWKTQVKMLRFKFLTRYPNNINLKIFPNHGGITDLKELRENPTNIQKRNKAHRSLWKYERMYR